MALAQEYCAANISWDEYVRTCEVVQRVLTTAGERLDESAAATAATAALSLKRIS
jgi:hypothetical protein